MKLDLIAGHRTFAFEARIENDIEISFEINIEISIEISYRNQFQNQYRNQYRNQLRRCIARSVSIEAAASKSTRGLWSRVQSSIYIYIHMKNLYIIYVDKIRIHTWAIYESIYGLHIDPYMAIHESIHGPYLDSAKVNRTHTGPA